MKCWKVRLKSGAYPVQVQAKNKSGALTEAAKVLQQQDRKYYDKMTITQGKKLPPLTRYKKFFSTVEESTCKKMKKIIIIILLLPLLPLLATSQSSPLYGVTPIAHCWLTGAGVDSTIYGAYLDAAGTTKPSRLHFFAVNQATFAINAVTVSGGTLTIGPCTSTGNCAVTDEWRVETITAASTAYATNTFNSIAVEAVSGTVTVSVDGATAVTLAVGTILTVRADACRYVQSSMTVAITSGSAIVSRYFRFDPDFFIIVP